MLYKDLFRIRAYWLSSFLNSKYSSTVPLINGGVILMNLNLDFNLNYDVEKSSPSSLGTDSIYDLLIIGGGPAGLNAVLYAKRKGLHVGMITTGLGGQVTNTSLVENYLGYPEIEGKALVNQFISHVEGLSVPILGEATVSSIVASPYDVIKQVLLTNGDTYRAKTLIIATGRQPKKLGLPGEEKFTGRGIAYCAICDGPLFKDREVAVVGGGNAALEAAIDLSKVAKKVTLIHRSELRADSILVNHLKNRSNVTILLKNQLTEILGNESMTGIRVLNTISQQEIFISIEGLFIEIGSIPNSEAFKGILDLNEGGEIIVDGHGRTNLPGVFAAGDVTNTPYKQIIVAAADGAKCALAANDYLNSIH